MVLTTIVLFSKSAQCLTIAWRFSHSTGVGRNILRHSQETPAYEIRQEDAAVSYVEKRKPCCSNDSQKPQKMVSIYPRS